MLRSIWLWVVGSVVGVLVLIRSLFFRKIRINREAAAVLYDRIRVEGRTFVIYEEMATQKLPVAFDGLCWLGGILPFRLYIEERMLRAGYASTDAVITFTALRWKVRGILAKIEAHKVVSDDISIYLLKPWDAEQIGKLKAGSVDAPIMKPALYETLEQSIADVVAKRRERTGALLHGPPGNGKSYLVRYLACKYKLPIYLVSFSPMMDNHEVIKMFSYLEGPAMVLMEDFDGYFKGRQSQLKEPKFTFDAVLNVLDGTYASMEGIVLMMTCNNLEDVDPALKNRPGRLRYVIRIPNPPRSIRREIFSGCPDAAPEDGRYNLDQLLFLRDGVMHKRKVGEAVPEHVVVPLKRSG